MRLNLKIMMVLFALLTYGAFSPDFAAAETVMTPRDKAAFEAEMQALNEKYGPKASAAARAAGSVPEMASKAEPATAEPGGAETIALATASNEAAASALGADSNAVQPRIAQRYPTPVSEPSSAAESAAESALLSAAANQQLSGASPNAVVTKLRIELSPKNAREFVFDGQSYTQPDLMPILLALKQKHALDYVVLLQAGAEPVQLTHIVELAKISRTLQTPAVYQDGTQLRAVDAR